MKKERKVWAITLIAFWALTPNQTHARQDSIRSVALQEVIVTATKFAKSSTETGKVVTVIDRVQLERSAGKDLAQLLNEQVGIVVNGAYSNAGKDKAVYMRGAGNAYTLILLDGIPLNDPSGINGGAYDLRLLSLDQVERIEIVKGSQSTLYGSEAMAGVINIISRNAGVKPIQAQAGLSYGSFNTRRGNAAVMGSTDVLDYNVSYQKMKTDGISEALDEANAGFDKDGAVQDAIQAAVGIKPMGNFSIRPFARYNRFNGDYDAGARTDDRQSNFETALFNWGASSQYTFKKGSVQALFGKENSDRTFNSAFGKFEYKGIFQHAEVFGRYNVNEKTQVIAGLNHQSWKLVEQTSPATEESTTIVSPYASLFLKPITNLSVELGTRFNSHSQFGSNATYSFNPSYLINKQAKLFFNLSTGFKAPSLTQLYGQFGANRDLKPERSRSTEAGVQWFSPNGKLNMRAVWFDRKLEDVIIYTGAFRYDNFDQQQDHGAEWEAEVSLYRWMKLQANYTYVTGETQTSRNNQPVEIRGLLRRPKHTLSMQAGFTCGENWFASITAQHFAKRQDQFFDLTDFSTQSVELDSYTLVNVYLENKMANNRVKCFVDVKNLLDADYEEIFGYSTFGINATVGVTLQLN